MKWYKCIQTNDYYQIELLILDKNTWNHLTMRIICIKFLEAVIAY